ncbi:hypothetical protein ES319_A13G222200v1 [Gossypium barbadense]|uniref:Leucine-rich repeat-containing N-terminal plant-type domain-containing protein n=1 Tax=Gossypium barbadense TaxID=3634 RepID=A0A5J5T8B3_GOSBA|nr:hypothetical protein ES319_A13G222200v1 [Gossypium barbadense]
MEYWKLVWVFVLAFLFGGYQSEGCWEIEKAALLQLKPFFPLINDEGISWGKGNCCRWNGVECSTSTGRVTRLFLEYSSVQVYNNISQGWYLNISLFLPFQELKSLDLGKNYIAGFIDNQGSFMNKLEILDLSHNTLLGNNILSYLVEFTSLKTLLLNTCGLQGSIDISELNSLKNLKELHLSGNQIESLGSLFQSKRELRLAKLEVLDLSFNYFNNSIFSSLAALPHLKSLNLESNLLIQSTYIQDLNVLSNLEKLTISYDIMDDTVPSQGNERELKLMNLEELNLWGNVFNSSILSSLGSLSSLKSLFLSHTYVMEESIDVRGLPALKNLEKLHLTGYIEKVNLQLQSFDIFPSLKTLFLESFSLNGTIIIQRWQNLTSLKELTLIDLSLTSNVVQDIGALTSLKDLVIDNCVVDDSLNLHGFCELRQLQTLAIINGKWNARLPECFSELISLKHLDLSFNNFSGDISMLKNLSSLEHLDLSYNNFSRDLSVFKNLSSLKYLDLFFNNFFGNIYVFKNLMSLEFLDLSSNKFSGDISHFRSLTSLLELRLWNNSIEIPSSLAPLFNLSKLQNIYADNNMIYNAETEKHSLDTPTFRFRSITLSCSGDGGSFPQSLNHQHDLQYVDLSNINFKGDQFPNWLLENNEKLQKLNLANSSLSGHFQLPSTSRRGLLYLDVSNNSLDGNIPNEIGAKLPSLKQLNMSNNLFSGGIPISIGDMISLEVLDLSNNKLSGGIPRHMPMGLLIFDVSNNRLFGDIQSSMENMSHLVTLDLSNNILSGGIPRWMGKMSDLEELVMANNHFEGPIPMEFCKLNRSLQFLDLSANNISGSLPSCFSSSILSHVYLSRNKLKGPITGFFNSSGLVTLDLSNNHLTGSIPNWIGTLFSLSYLLLNNNRFEGGIPIQLCKLNGLSLIDVSNNNLSGTIPPCLMITTLNDSSHAYYGIPYQYGNYRSFSADVPIEVTMKSISYFYKGRVLTYLSGIDLSCNKLTGEIPHHFQYLRDIIVLNFSHNSLIGPIPPALSELYQIEIFLTTT